MGQPMPSEWMTVTEAAELFRIHRKTIYRQLASGTFPVETKRFGHQWRISRGDAADKLDEIAAMMADLDDGDES
jgi:excisionase family DNA binding protein